MDAISIKVFDTFDAVAHVHIPAIAGFMFGDVWQDLTLDLFELFHGLLFHDFNH